MMRFEESLKLISQQLCTELFRSAHCSLIKTCTFFMCFLLRFQTKDILHLLNLAKETAGNNCYSLGKQPHTIIKGEGYGLMMYSHYHSWLDKYK